MFICLTFLSSNAHNSLIAVELISCNDSYCAELFSDQADRSSLSTGVYAMKAPTLKVSRKLVGVGGYVLTIAAKEGIYNLSTNEITLRGIENNDFKEIILKLDTYQVLHF